MNFLLLVYLWGSFWYTYPYDTFPMVTNNLQEIVIRKTIVHVPEGREECMRVTAERWRQYSFVRRKCRLQILHFLKTRATLLHVVQLGKDICNDGYDDAMVRCRYHDSG